ncbi:hypothetical protein EDEG_01435 [Edhazardia aedis USNM 41457]|uniref:Proteasome alpha-type subunits domain-containing protein n=1 Tax=Edhazardia aedis (strain USNM 41457) TaxID=1003232 RepID=J9D960_EDHAE|nr:hypothetical protein EDEG_01435 [Edhazardia aedis USNM 41457]|eukprot:EJW04311.1 hypothetical protein EDEG_01435 [Edhazardia aedis USNM 41457]
MSYRNYDYVSLFNPEGKVEPFTNIEKTTQLGALSVALINEKTLEGIILAHKITTHLEPQKIGDDENLLESKISLEFPRKKIFKVGPKTLFSFSGITNDGLEIYNYLLNMCVNERVNKNRSIDAAKVFDDLCVEAGARLMVRNNRPFGCTTLLLNIVNNKELSLDSSVDQTTSSSNNSINKRIQLVEFGVAGKVNLCYAVSIGNRSQSARTILEKYYNDNMSLQDMINLGIRSMKNAINDLTPDVVEIYALNDKGIHEIDPKQYM